MIWLNSGSSEWGARIPNVVLQIVEPAPTGMLLACRGLSPMPSKVELEVVTLEKAQDVNVILGQAHFIKTVDDLHDVLVRVVPAARFGVAFCEASGLRLIRRSGNDDEMLALAVRNAQAIGAGHCFVILLRNVFPLSVLNAVKMVPEVCRIFCASANDVQVLVAKTDLGRGIAGVVDGSSPLGVEMAADVEERRALIRRLGYRL